MVAPGSPKEVKSTDSGQFFCLFFLYLGVIPFLFVFVYHLMPTTVIVFIFFEMCVDLVPLVFNRGDTVVSEPVGPLLAAAMIACTTIISLSSMHLYWNHVQPMRALMTAREYHGVYPQLAAVAFKDASYIHFAGSVTVGVDEAVSIKSVDAAAVSFCAAPIKNRENTGRIEFWAIGVDCCGEHGLGKFECDNAAKWNSTGRTALVMQNPRDDLFDSVGKYIAPYMVRRDMFQLGIRKAERTKGLVSPKEPMLVRLTEDSKESLIVQEVIKVAVRFVFNAIASAVMAFGLLKLKNRFTALRAQARFEKFGTESAEVSTRLHEFLHAATDKARGHQQKIAEDADKLLRNVIQRPPLSKWDMALMGVTLPYCVMLGCAFLGTYSGCWRNGSYIYAPIMTMLGLFIMALLATPNRRINALFFILMATTGLYIGYWNYNTNMFHYCEIESRRSYSNVLADDNSETYRDAGTLSFDASAFLVQNYSSGFLYQDNVYCVAPIMSRDSCTEDKAKKEESGAGEESAKGESGKEASGASGESDSAASGEKAESDSAASGESDSTASGESDSTGKSDSAASGDDAAADSAASSEKAAFLAQSSESFPSFLQRTSRMHARSKARLEVDGEAVTVAHHHHKHHRYAGQCDAIAPKKIDFWAIGINCCGKRRDFKCDGGKDKSARNAVIVRETGAEQPGGPRDQLLNAIEQSVAANGLMIPENPMFVRWGPDAAALKNDFKTRAGGALILTAMIGLLANLLIGIGSFLFMRSNRLKELKQERLEEDDARQEYEKAEQRGELQSPTAGQAAQENSSFFSKARGSLNV